MNPRTVIANLDELAALAETVADADLADLVAETRALRAAIARVRGIVDRVAADPSNVTDELWVYSIRKALDGDQ